ncbi:MAG: DapH/DapD/GlmU-related protein [Alphaproteobacteria bacterium]
MTSVVILGGDSSGGLVLQAIEDLAESGREPVLECAGYLNDMVPKGKMILERPVLGGFDDWPSLPSDAHFISAVYNPTGMRDRWQRLTGLGIPDERWVSVLHPAAWVARSAAVGVGCFISPGVVITALVTVGAHSAIRTGVHIGHHATVGVFSFVGANASINGHCRIGDRAHIGPNSAIRDGVSIGDGAVVGIGSVVVKDVPAATIVAGNPARVMRTID